MKKAKKRALSLRTLTVSMLMVILLAALAVFVSTNASSAVSDSDMLSAKEVSEFGEPKITMTTEERSYNYLEFSVTVSGSDHSQLYIDWGDGNPAEVSSSDIVDVMCSGDVLGNTIKIYSEQTITEFSCTGPMVVSSIDVSKCVDLESLTITNSLLKKLDISQNTKLTTLNCGNNPLTELDTSKNTMLTKLDCGYSNLSKLDLTNNTKLEYLGCSYNELTELDLSKNTNLRILDCSSNKLRFADIKVDYSKLTSTNIGRQRIVPAKAEPGVTIDLSAEYSINGNITSYEWKSLTTTDNNTSYTTITPTTSENGVFTFGEEFDGKKIYCRMTIMLSDAPNDVVNFTTSYIIIQSPASEDDMQITMTTSKNIGDTFEFKAAYLYHYSGTTEIDGVEEFIEYDECIPLENIYVDWGDGKIVPVDSEYDGGYNCCYSGELKGNTVKIYTTDSLYDTRQVLEYFKCKEQGLTSIDVSKVSNLKEFDCHGNNLTNLDVSQNTLLTYLDCSENQISELDVSKNINLKFLECYINNIPSLDISKHSNLISIDCGKNPLSELNVSNNTKLQSLLCWETNITDLDISNCTDLYSLYCNACRLTSLDVSNNINLEYLACNQNQLTQLDVSNCPKLDIMCVDKNNLTELDISQNTKINILTISGNNIRFSTLKIDPNNFLFINEELDKEQNPIEIASSIAIGDTIDLSSEYDFYGTKTDYTWYDSDGSEVTPTTSENGVFTFGEEFGGKTVYCTMTNSLCPYMILKTTSVNIPSNKPCEHKNTEIQNAKEATCAEEGYTGDKVCSECKNTIETGTAIPKLTAHKLGDWHYADETSHKRSCSLCDYEETDSHFGGMATYTEQAKCVLCGAGYGELKAAAISFNTEALTLIVGDSQTVTACKYPEEREDSITWTSSKESVAAVDANGKVTAVAKGKAVITAKLSNGSSASIQVTVVSQPRRETQSIVIKKSACTLTIKRSKLNPTVSLYASIKGDATGKSWYSDNVNVATVNKSGKVTAVGEGTANIYCRTADGTTSAPCV
ncbi:MAG: Ig-like domain-containing protein, partial [Firmicutes bacterium]|nr:Ig-like domain-containing protein [Bacillota bacterium]